MSFSHKQLIVFHDIPTPYIYIYIADIIIFFLTSYFFFINIRCPMNS